MDAIELRTYYNVEIDEDEIIVVPKNVKGGGVFSHTLTNGYEVWVKVPYAAKEGDRIDPAACRNQITLKRAPKDAFPKTPTNTKVNRYSRFWFRPSKLAVRIWTLGEIILLALITATVYSHPYKTYKISPACFTSTITTPGTDTANSIRSTDESNGYTYYLNIHNHGGMILSHERLSYMKCNSDKIDEKNDYCLSLEDLDVWGRVDMALNEKYKIQKDVEERIPIFDKCFIISLILAAASVSFHGTLIILKTEKDFSIFFFHVIGLVCVLSSMIAIFIALSAQLNSDIFKAKIWQEFFSNGHSLIDILMNSDVENQTVTSTSKRDNIIENEIDILANTYNPSLSETKRYLTIGPDTELLSSSLICRVAIHNGPTFMLGYSALAWSLLCLATIILNGTEVLGIKVQSLIDYNYNDIDSHQAEYKTEYKTKSMPYQPLQGVDEDSRYASVIFKEYYSNNRSDDEADDEDSSGRTPSPFGSR